MRWIGALFGGVLLIPILGALVLAVGSSLSLDGDAVHGRATAALPEFDAAQSRGTAPVLSRIRVGDFSYRARSAGFGGGAGNVILLHGFPESSAMYEPMIPALAAAGYQVVAFDQRGYSPGARPPSVSDYEIEHLVADVFDVAAAVGFDRFHLVGHDWGAAVGWMLVLDQPGAVDSWSALSIPHMEAYGRAVQEDPDQQARSAYVGLFRTPWLPEALLSFNAFSLMRGALYAEHQEDIVREYISIFSEPGALTAAFNWYRAVPMVSSGEPRVVTVPTAFIWGNEDPAVGRAAVDAQRPYFDGGFEERELDTGHWLMETHPEEVTGAVLAHIQAHSERSTATVEPSLPD